MDIVKENKDEMKTIVKGYKGCGHEEYYGMLVTRNGMMFCRKCIYSKWERESNWKHDPKVDFIFPLYEDGRDYTK